ncbi:MAG TPA: phosphate ABC transporter permease PstA [Coriobacteriia bacterium]
MSDMSIKGRPHPASVVGTTFAWVAAALVATVCFFIIGFLVYQGSGAINWTFLTTDPQASLMAEQAGGIRVPFVGTAILILGSILVAFPLAIGAAVYLAEYMADDSWFTRTVRLGLEVLASVPSVVFGVFGLSVFTFSIFQGLSAQGAQGADTAFGRSFIVASIVMGIHILPFIIKVAEEAIRSVPKSLRQGALALGMTNWRTIRRVVLPSASPGIVTAVVLGMGLAAGDTAIVWLTLGGSINMAVDNWWNPSQWVEVLRGTGATLTTYVYFNSPAGEGNAPGMAFGAALVLIVLVLAFNLIAVYVGRRSANAGRR